MFYQILKSSWNSWHKVFQKILIGNHVTGEIIWGKKIKGEIGIRKKVVVSEGDEVWDGIRVDKLEV